MRERKRLIRLLICDVTLTKTSEHIVAHVRLPGGTRHTLTVPRPLRAWEAHTTAPATIARIDELLAEHTYDETVAILDQRGLTGGWGKPFSVVSLTQLCRARGIPDHQQRLRAAGMLTLDEIADQLGVTTGTIKTWQHRGLITGRRIVGRRAHVYDPGQTRPADRRRRPQPAKVRAVAHNAPDRTRNHISPQPHQEAQCEAHSLERPRRIAARIPSRYGVGGESPRSFLHAAAALR